MEVVCGGEIRQRERGVWKTTDDGMGRTAELFLKVGYGERDAKEVDGIAGPSQPAGKKKR